jgi:hypothetical protein
LMMIEFFLQCLQFFSCNEQNNISNHQQTGMPGLYHHTCYPHNLIPQDAS